MLVLERVSIGLQREMLRVNSPYLEPQGFPRFCLETVFAFGKVFPVSNQYKEIPRAERCSIVRDLKGNSRSIIKLIPK